MTVPVPLTDIEAAAREATPGPWRANPDGRGSWEIDDDEGLVARVPRVVSSGPAAHRPERLTDAAYIATADPPTVLALCEALRIAVEGLDVFAAADTEWISGLAGERLAAVRELVDLGEKP